MLKMEVQHGTSLARAVLQTARTGFIFDDSEGASYPSSQQPPTRQFKTKTQHQENPTASQRSFGATKTSVQSAQGRTADIVVAAQIKQTKALLCQFWIAGEFSAAVVTQTLTGPLIVPEARRSPGLRLHPLIE